MENNREKGERKCREGKKDECEAVGDKGKRVIGKGQVGEEKAGWRKRRITVTSIIPQGSLLCLILFNHLH